MSLPKTLSKHGVLLALETTSYGSGTPVLAPATDGFKVYETPEAQIGFQFDGAREGTPGTGAQDLIPVPASGRSARFELVHYFQGANAAYTASVKSSVDRILRGLGFSATVGGSAGAEKVTYAPAVLDGVLSSLVGEVYSRGQKYPLKGAYVHKLVIESKGHMVPKWTASLAGILSSAPVDAAVPAITYPLSGVRTPKATAIGLTLTSGAQVFSPKVREWTLTIERELVELLSQNEANGDHRGFHLGDLTATFSCLIEHTAAVVGTPYASATAFDGDRIFENAMPVLVDLNVAGGMAAPLYNRFKLDANNAFLSAPPRYERDGTVPLAGLDFKLRPSSDDAFDVLSLVTD